MLLTVLTGLVAGAMHVVTGPDHMAALAPIAVEDRGHAVRLGALWGAGHGVGVAVIGGLGTLAADRFDVDGLSVHADLIVGLTLLAVGAWALWRSRTLTVHAHGGLGHLHSHGPGEAHGPGEGPHLHHHAAFGVGLFHGAAGTGHVFGVIPALALPPREAAIFLAAYLIAAVLSMAGMGWVLGAFARRLKGPGVLRLMAVSGAIAVGVGILSLLRA
jgi:hypothetical protein